MNVDLEKLLQPISADNPAGEWLRYEGTYDRIQEARREDDESLPQGVWKTKLKRSEPTAVVSLCSEALQQRTKDLQIAAFLTEAWMKLSGLEGAVVGLRLLQGLCERFWPTLYPLIDDTDLSFRLSPFEWLDQRLAALVRTLPLCSAAGRRAVTYADWERLLSKSARRAKEEEAATSGDDAPPTQDAYLALLQRAPSAELLKLANELDAMHQQMEGLVKAVDGLAGQETALLLHSRRLIEGVLGLLRPYGAEAARVVEAVRNQPAEAGSETGSGPAVAGRVSAGAGALPVGGRGGAAIESRAQAYLILDEVAEYLLRTEPHSPTGYLIKRAVRWGELPLTRLLLELVPEERNVAAIYQLLGVTPPRQERE